MREPLGQGDTDITNHLPTVFASQEFHHTSPIRAAVGLEAGKPRVLRVIAFAYLEPITSFPEKNLFVLGLNASVVGAIKTHSSLNN